MYTTCYFLEFNEQSLVISGFIAYFLQSNQDIINSGIDTWKICICYTKWRNPVNRKSFYDGFQPHIWIFPGHFFCMTFTRSQGPSTMHIEYYGTSWRCLAAILADLQAIVGNRHWKREISLKIDFDGSNLLWGCKIIKKSQKMVGNTRCPKLPELKNLKKSHLLTPRVNLYLQNPLSYPLCYTRLSFLYGTFLFLVFGQKPLVSNQFSIFKPPRFLGIVNIQARISGLSFGVARELFSEFRS